MNELFSGWNEYPPTNLLLKALVEGFGGGSKPQVEPERLDIPPEAALAMQRSAAAEISTRIGRGLPMVRGRDTGLPKAPPVFDIDEMRKRNEAIKNRRGLKVVGNV